MRLAILADIRANEPALLAVLTRLEQLKVDRVWCIGSLLSYGPDPVAVVDRVRQPPVDGHCLVGHPDGSLLTPDGMPAFNRVARRAFTWACDQLRPRWWSGSVVRSRWDWITGRPSTAEEGEWQLYSGTPQAPEVQFLPIFGPPSQTGPKTQVAPLFAPVRRGAFVGTVCIPGIVFADDLIWQPTRGSEHSVAIAGRKFIACPGSVGQPRDGDPRAAFLIVDGETITWHRVDYDVHEAMRRIRAHSELSAFYADRLELGR